MASHRFPENFATADKHFRKPDACFRLRGISPEPVSFNGRYYMIQSIEKVKAALQQIIRGKEECIDLLLAGILAGGHILMDDVPGVGKTTLAKALAKTLGLDFKRVQFTPDLLPADILGASVFHPGTGDFHMHKGPVFTNIFLADEINRASPRTQSALLEAMNEKHVSLDGTLHSLPEPFLVIATENPMEYHGTYPLPEAQLDRFAMRLKLGYPDEEAEFALLNDRRTSDPLEQLDAVITPEEFAQAKRDVQKIEMEKSVLQYLHALIEATRKDPRIKLGASPRAWITFTQCARARAWLKGRPCITPEDVRVLAEPLLAHRLVPDMQFMQSGSGIHEILADLLNHIRVPA